MYSYSYSYIDKAGKIIIDASKYENAYSFSEGLALVYLVSNDRKMAHYGFIDKAGNEVIQPQFQSVWSFSEGLAAVEIEGQWGFIDKVGQIVINPEYDSAKGFSEGVAIVSKGEEDWLIDRDGNQLFSCNGNDVALSLHEEGRFSEGLLTVYDPTAAKYGFIDKTGKFVIEPKFARASSFSEGLARVAVVVEGEEMLAFIGHHGEFVIPPKFNTDVDFLRGSTNFSEGVASLTENLRPTITEEEKFVYIDKSGTIILFTDFFYAGPFREGLAVVYDDGKSDGWGFIDKLGNVVIPLQYNRASDFSEGLACVATQVS